MLVVASFETATAQPARGGEAAANAGASSQPAVPAAPARDGTDEILAPPPTYQAGGVTVDEHLGARLPIDAKFRTHDGKSITLGEALRGDLPTILTFNYADCPMLCSMMLNGLTAAMPGAAKPGPAPVNAAAAAAGAPRSGDVVFRLGAQYRILTISLEPNEKLDKLTKMRTRYIDRLPEDQRADAQAGWTYLTGDAEEIRRVAEVVGFKYTFIPERAEWAHPAAFIFLSSAGIVTRYVYGIELEPAVLRESIFKAGLAEPATATGFMLRCYHYDPDANNHSRAGMMALRVAAGGFVVLLLVGLGVLHLLRRHSRSPRPRHGEVS
ncbi:MAG: SCO1/SenC/PrrC family protein [Deltaproteobacteria bacterium]|nr:SCO1/SenC/PrrC family protein [Deltaproteobacteria bacterium]